MIGRNFHYLRKTNNVNIDTLKQIFGVGTTQYYAREKGEAITLNDLEIASKYYRVSVYDLIFDEMSSFSNAIDADIDKSFEAVLKNIIDTGKTDNDAIKEIASYIYLEKLEKKESEYMVNDLMNELNNNCTSSLDKLQNCIKIKYLNLWKETKEPKYLITIAIISILYIFNNTMEYLKKNTNFSLIYSTLFDSKNLREFCDKYKVFDLLSNLGNDTIRILIYCVFQLHISNTFNDFNAILVPFILLFPAIDDFTLHNDTNKLIVALFSYINMYIARSNRYIGIFEKIIDKYFKDFDIYKQINDTVNDIDTDNLFNK